MGNSEIEISFDNIDGILVVKETIMIEDYCVESGIHCTIRDFHGVYTILPEHVERILAKISDNLNWSIVEATDQFTHLLRKT